LENAGLSTSTRTWKLWLVGVFHRHCSWFRARYTSIIKSAGLLCDVMTPTDHRRSATYALMPGDSPLPVASCLRSIAGVLNTILVGPLAVGVDGAPTGVPGRPVGPITMGDAGGVVDPCRGTATGDKPGCCCGECDGCPPPNAPGWPQSVRRAASGLPPSPGAGIVVGGAGDVDGPAAS
jgi:hypothetical protein